MNLAEIQDGTIAMMCRVSGKSEAEVVKSKAFNDWMNWLESRAPEDPLNCDPPEVRRDIADGRRMQARCREKPIVTLSEIIAPCFSVPRPCSHCIPSAAVNLRDWKKAVSGWIGGCGLM